MYKKAEADVTQVRGIVKERNKYKELLDLCVKAFNYIPNTELPVGNTYTLVSKIEKVLSKYNR